MKYLTLAVLSAAVAVLAGCAGHDTAYKGPGVTAEPAHNLVGAIKLNPSSYRYIDETGSVVLRTDELWCRRDFTGTNITLLWGLVHIADY